MPWKGKPAREKERPKKPKIIGKMPVMHNGQKPVTNPPKVPIPAAVAPSLHLCLSLYFANTYTPLIATRIPITNDKIREIDSFNQLTVFA